MAPEGPAPPRVVGVPAATVVAGETTPDRTAVLEEVSALLAAFNQTLQEEAKDRKYRFHVKRLLKTHLQTGEDIDPDLDFITDDDDVADLRCSLPSTMAQKSGRLATLRLLR